MNKLVLLSFILIISNSQVNAQRSVVVNFLNKIFDIEELIQNENKLRLERELGYFSKGIDEMINLKIELTDSLINYCNSNDQNERKRQKISRMASQFKNFETGARRHLEIIRRNILFESDYNIIIDTVFIPIPISQIEDFDINSYPDCYVKLDTIIPVPEEYHPEIRSPKQKMYKKPKDKKRETIPPRIEERLYCPKVIEDLDNLKSWKAVSFEEFTKSLDYSLQTKSANVTYLSTTCNQTKIIREKNRSIKVLTAMRDKALELKREIKTD